MAVLWVMQIYSHNSKYGRSPKEWAHLKQMTPDLVRCDGDTQESMQEEDNRRWAPYLEGNAVVLFQIKASTT